MIDAERERFDVLLDQVIADLPPHVRELFDDAPLIVEDHPTPEILQEFGMEEEDGDDLLCGLYTGTPLTDRSVEGGPEAPDHIYIFRDGIIDHAGGWIEDVDDQGERFGGVEAIAREIRITILHELGHHFGMDEDDLMRMGYD